MIAKEVFVNYYNLNPIWVQHASVHAKKYWYWYSSQKGTVKAGNFVIDV